jgi:hypothetical protein
MMEAVMRAVEATGTIDEHGELHLDWPITTVRPGRVRVLLLMADEADFDEQEWMRAAARNPAFDFLNDPAEDIYTHDDGRPFHDEG